MSSSSRFVKFDSSFPLHELMESVASKMQADFDGITSQFQHKSTKGTAREKIVHHFLAEYLPESIELGTGEIVDTFGNRSSQTDLIIFDRLRCPKIFQTEDLRIYPVEGVLAAIEVKTKLDKSTLEESVLNIQNAKKLQKAAFYPTGNIVDSWVLYGIKYDYFPMMGYIFAFKSIQLESLGQRLDEINLENEIPPEHQVDAICLLDKGIIAHSNNEGQIISWAEPTDLEKNETTVTGINTKHSLLIFYVMLHDQLSIAKSRPIQMIKYIPGSLKFGDDED